MPWGTWFYLSGRFTHILTSLQICTFRPIDIPPRASPVPLSGMATQSPRRDFTILLITRVSFGQFVEHPSFSGCSRPSKVSPRNQGDHLGRRTVCIRAVDMGNRAPKHQPRTHGNQPQSGMSHLVHGGMRREPLQDEASEIPRHGPTWPCCTSALDGCPTAVESLLEVLSATMG